MGTNAAAVDATTARKRKRSEIGMVLKLLKLLKLLAARNDYYSFDLSRRLLLELFQDSVISISTLHLDVDDFQRFSGALFVR